MSKNPYVISKCLIGKQKVVNGNYIENVYFNDLSEVLCEKLYGSKIILKTPKNTKLKVRYYDNTRDNNSYYVIMKIGKQYLLIDLCLDNGFLHLGGKIENVTSKFSSIKSFLRKSKMKNVGKVVKPALIRRKLDIK